MQYVQATCSEERNQSDVAEIRNVQVENSSTVFGQNVAEGRNGGKCKERSDEDNDVMENLNGEAYKKNFVQQNCVMKI